MNKETRLAQFKLELDQIQNNSIKDFTEIVLSKLPDYFFNIPASSTGKYHPKYALGDGGLVRHTKAAVRFALELFRCDTCTGKFTQLDKDMIVSALILHDGLKSGLVKQQYTITEHPLEIVKFCNNDEEIKSKIDTQSFDIISGLISSHMGQWNYDYKSHKEVLPKPITAMQRFVHMCDYLASRKSFEFDSSVELSN